MAKRKQTNGQLSGNVARSLLKHGANGAKKVVVVYKDGVPSRVYGYEEHQRMVELPQQVKPWEHRQGRSETPEPLGGVDGGVIGTLSRQDIYE